MACAPDEVSACSGRGLRIALVHAVAHDELRLPSWRRAQVSLLFGLDLKLQALTLWLPLVLRLIYV